MATAETNKFLAGIEKLKAKGASRKLTLEFSSTTLRTGARPQDGVVNTPTTVGPIDGFVSSFSRKQIDGSTVLTGDKEIFIPAKELGGNIVDPTTIVIDGTRRYQAHGDVEDHAWGADATVMYSMQGREV